MRIGLEDIDPQIAASVAERLCAPSTEFLKESIHWGGYFPWRLKKGTLQFEKKREPSEDERRAYEICRKREEQIALRSIVGGLTPIFAGVGLFAGLHGIGFSDGSAMTTAVGTWLAGSSAGVWWTVRATPRFRLRKNIRLEEMKAVFPLLSLTRAERVYCDSLQMLVRIEADSSAEITMRDALKQLNDLLHSARQIDSRKQALLPILGMNAVPDLQTEYGELGRKLDRTQDTMLRQSLQQSLQMCASRLENAKNLQLSLERLNMQQEAIVQTLATAVSAMARLQVASTAQAEIAAQQIAETVSQMNRQTYAVEQAVEEVMTLRVQ